MTKPGNTYAQRRLKPLVKLPIGEVRETCECGGRLRETCYSSSPYGKFRTMRCECGNRYQIRFPAEPTSAKYATLKGRIVRQSVSRLSPAESQRLIGICSCAAHDPALVFKAIVHMLDSVTEQDADWLKAHLRITSVGDE